MKKLLTAITVFLAISSFFMMADDGQRLRNFLFIYDVDNTNERMLDDADSTFGWLLDFGNGKSMVYVLDAECSVCIGQYMNFLSEYSDYIVSESAADAVPLVVLAKGMSLDILQYYLDENRSKFNSRASERLEIDTVRRRPDLWTVITNNRTYKGDNILNMLPVYVPRAGDEIVLTDRNIALYKRIICLESGEEILNTEKYSFKQNYYFVCGDNMLFSYDSRQWGFVPEHLIISKVIFPG